MVVAVAGLLWIFVLCFRFGGISQFFSFFFLGCTRPAVSTYGAALLIYLSTTVVPYKRPAYDYVFSLYKINLGLSSTQIADYLC